MKLYQLLLSGFAMLLAAVCVSCVKNDPFLQAYTVPENYTYTTNDSSATAQIIMMCGMQNYLAKAPNVVLTEAITDSLWLNKGNPFTKEIVPNFLYPDTILNKMTATNLAADTGDLDSMVMMVDSVVYLSQFNGTAAVNGTAGTHVVGATKRLFDSAGAEMSEVWSNAMLGAMCVTKAFGHMINSSTSADASWDLAYAYLGLPKNYDPSVDYNATPIQADRPLGTASLFYGARSINAGSKIYKEFKRAKTAANAGDIRVSAPSIDTIKTYTEKTLAFAAVSNIDSCMQSSDVYTRLHYLSRVYGIVWALKYTNLYFMSIEDYWMIRGIVDANFYGLVQETAFTKIKKVRGVLATAYGL